jgi:hypothetical protein
MIILKFHTYHEGYRLVFHTTVSLVLGAYARLKKFSYLNCWLLIRAPGADSGLRNPVLVARKARTPRWWGRRTCSWPLCFPAALNKSRSAALWLGIPPTTAPSPPRPSTCAQHPCSATNFPCRDAMAASSTTASSGACKGLLFCSFSSSESYC